MAVIGYTRRSRKQDNGSYGLDDQRGKLEAWSAYRERPLDRVIAEDDTSGAVPPDERPDLGPVLAELGPGDELVIPKFDRLSRSLADFASLIRRSQREGWSLVCLEPEIDLSTPTGRAFAQMLAVFAEFEREQYIDRMKGGKRAKAASGGYVGGKRLARRFGSELATNADGELEYIDVLAERAVIEKLKRAYSGGAKLDDLAADLSKSPFQTTTGKEDWSRQTVAAVLKREGVQMRPRGRQPVAA
jgi:DNA invertase Pin-like site-specific DNA recombinase